jgi:hypothetical protein
VLHAVGVVVFSELFRVPWSALRPVATAQSRRDASNKKERCPNASGAEIALRPTRQGGKRAFPRHSERGLGRPPALQR